MSQSIAYQNLNDGYTSRRYTGYPLNSTLVSSYTPDTIRSIITHAAAGQPYSTAVWIRINRAGIQISAQDTQIARTRTPVFIPIGLTHDIFMLPSINNVICIVYDEVQSNMKGVLLYVIHPTDAQLIRDDFRIVKQASNTQQPASYPTPLNTRYSNINEIYPVENNQPIQQLSPRRLDNVRENEIYIKPGITPTLPQISYTPSKGSYHSDHQYNKSPRRNVSANSPTKRFSDNTSIKKERKNRSRSPDKKVTSKLLVSRSNHDLTQEQQQQQLFLQQQQQMAALQAAQQMPLIPMGIYNRYVPKTIPLPTGETLKTTIPPPGLNGAAMNGTAMAYIEPYEPADARQINRSISRSPPNSLQRQQTQQQQSWTPNPSTTHRHRRHHHRRHHTTDNAYGIIAQPPRSRAKNNSTISDTDEETRQYLKMLVDEMQAMKFEMSRLRQTPLGTSKGRSDSLQVDLKEIRSHIDAIRTRIAMTPRIIE